MTAAASQSGRFYQIQHSADLSGGLWTDVGTVQAGTGGELRFVLPVNFREKGFYRIAISRP